MYYEWFPHPCEVYSNWHSNSFFIDWKNCIHFKLKDTLANEESWRTQPLTTIFWKRYLFTFVHISFHNYSYWLSWIHYIVIFMSSSTVSVPYMFHAFNLIGFMPGLKSALVFFMYLYSVCTLTGTWYAACSFLFKACMECIKHLKRNFLGELHERE